MGPTRLFSALCACILLYGCATRQDVLPETPTLADQSLGADVTRPMRVVEPFVAVNSNLSSSIVSERGGTVGFVPNLSEATNPSGYGNTIAPQLGASEVEAFVPAMPLVEFIDVVFGEMLDVSYVTGPAVADRNDVIQLRASGNMEAERFLDLIKVALEEYGVRVIAESGAFKIVTDETLRSRIPEFITSRARLRTRPDLRPVVQFVVMKSVEANSMLTIIKGAFGNDSQRLRVESNPRGDSLSLMGLPEDVDAALRIIDQLDELEFAGSQVIRYTPKYWEVGPLSTELTQALGLEGWRVSSNPNETRAISLLPVDFSNDLFIFTKLPEARLRVSEWLEELDRPIERGDADQLFIYQVENVDARILAEIANGALGGGEGLSVLTGGSDGSIQASQRGSNSQRSGSAFNSAQTTGATAPSSNSGPFTVDPLGNRIIFAGTSVEYEKVAEFLAILDTPAPEVLIEVQIAEVTLTDDLNYGVEIFDGDVLNGGGTLTTSTDALGLGTAGLNVRLLSGDVDIALNALASNRQVKVLSTPVLVARSGGIAEIQVGQDVPVISSQRASGSQDGVGGLDVLQSVQYRATGVLLSIEPIVFSDKRVDLTISQEVSSTIDTSNSAISSPTISNRSLTTQLSLNDGQTAVLGGLIQETVVRNESGVPILKDVPFIGNAFSNDTFSRDRTELVVLITAYVLRGQADKDQFARILSRRVESAFGVQGKMVTLDPLKM